MAYNVELRVNNSGFGTDIANKDRTVYIRSHWDILDGKPSTYAPAAHNQDASTINSGVLADARIPSLAISKITNLQTNLDLKSEKLYVHSRGQNLLTNGSALLGNNTNFSTFTFDGSQAYYSGGSFKYKRPENGGQVTETNEFMPVNPQLRYKFEMYARSLNSTGRYYAMIMCYDVDGLAIAASHHMYRANTLTELAEDLLPGATKVKLVSAANWDNSGTAGVNTHLRSFIFWNYTNSYGYLYPELTYSRNWYGNAWDPGAINFTTNEITLRVAWAGPAIAAGTKVSNGSSGGTYKYLALGYTLIPTTWTYYSGIMSGVDLSGTNAGGKFPPGTAKTKIGWLMDYDVSGDTVWFANLAFGIDYPYRSEMADKLTTPRQINGVNFDGSSNITITANANDVKTWAKDGLVESYTGNMNDLVTTGFYQGNSLTNAPTTGWYFYIVSRYRADSNWVSQIAMSFGSGNTGNKTYTRMRISGTWSSWVELYSTGNKPSMSDLGGRTAAEITAEIGNAISDLLEAAPSTLDTLNELAAALGDDPNFATTVNTALGNRVIKNADITPGTKAKITYDAKGLVTGGADLIEADIPTLQISKISGLQAALDAKLSSIASDYITNTMLANMAVNTLKGRVTAGTGDPEDLSVSQVKTMLSLNNVDNVADASKYVLGLRETRANTQLKIWNGTQAQYDAIGTKDTTTIYFIEA